LTADRPIDPDKSALRRRLRALRRRLAADLPDAARQAAGRLPLRRLPPFRVFSLYHPVGSELDPMPLLAVLLGPERTAALPAAVAADAPLVFRRWSPGLRLAPDALGVPAPDPVSPTLRPDLVVAPLLAFDRRGGRLGQGGGSYDRTLANLRAEKPVFVIGLAYSGQEVDALPVESHDQRLDAILTETEYLEVR
jgi:5-formyltetrahydrofolate cyclo-ligase